MAEDADLAFLRKQLAALATASGRRIDGTGGPPHDTGMEERVARLETHMDYVRRDLGEIKADNRAVLGKLDGVANSLSGLHLEVADKASTSQLWHIVGVVAVLALTVVGLVIGGLDWIKIH